MILHFYKIAAASLAFYYAAWLVGAFDAPQFSDVFHWWLLLMIGVFMGLDSGYRLRGKHDRETASRAINELHKGG